MNEDNSKAGHNPTLQRPRSPRLPANFNVTLDGALANGKTFHATAAAIKISRGGATLISDIAVENGAPIKLSPPFGPCLDAEVNGVWIDQSDGKQRIGIKLLHPNGWFAE